MIARLLGLNAAQKFDVQKIYNKSDERASAERLYWQRMLESMPETSRSSIAIRGTAHANGRRRKILRKSQRAYASSYRLRLGRCTIGMSYFRPSAIPR